MKFCTNLHDKPFTLFTVWMFNNGFHLSNFDERFKIPFFPITKQRDNQCNNHEIIRAIINLVAMKPMVVDLIAHLGHEKTLEQMQRRFHWP